jgi:hypothetical protein
MAKLLKSSGTLKNMGGGGSPRGGALGQVLAKNTDEDYDVIWKSISTGSSTWYHGEGVPNPATGVDGDFYLDDLSADYYHKATGAWELAGCFQGPQGLQGFSGEPGSQGPRGYQGFSGEPGEQGLTGSQGPRGFTGANGEDGDEVEFNKSATHIQWKLTTDIIWIDLVALSELQGETGPRGYSGEPGSIGQTGPQGPQGFSGEPGEQGFSGEPGLGFTAGPQTIYGVKTFDDIPYVSSGNDPIDDYQLATVKYVDEAIAGDVETDPVFVASAAYTINSGDIADWDEAHSWGNHASAGYLTEESDATFVNSPAYTINSADIADWDEAHSWGDHSTEGYLTEETDPVFSASPAASINSGDIEDWDEAHSWGDHADAGYITEEVDPVFSASPAFSISSGDIELWDRAGALPALLQDPTGFDYPENVIVTYSSATQEITLTGTFVAYWNGQIVPELTSGWVSSPHTDTVGHTYFLSYDGNSYTWSDNAFPGFAKLLIAIVNYGTSDKYGMREAHGFIPWRVHDIIHDNIGTYKEEGGTIPGASYTLNSTNASDRRPDIDETTIMDEDMPAVLPALTGKKYTQLFLTSTGTTTYAVEASDILPLTVNNPHYNRFSSPNWGQTIMPANSISSVWVYAIPVTADANSQKYRYLFVQPQWITKAQSAAAPHKATALAAELLRVPSELNLGTITVETPEIVCIGRIAVWFTTNWSLASVSNVSGNKYSQIGSPAGNFLSIVTTDATLTGTGTTGNPLAIVESDPVFSASPSYNISSADIQNWDEAHGWGNHTGEGYLTEETDPIYSASIAATINSGDLTRWNGAVQQDGSTPLTADWDAGGYKITAEQLESDATQGTSPFLVASTTLVSSLNADMVDGRHASEFLISSANLNDVTDKQTALNTITNVTAAENESILTKDTGTGDATWKEFTITDPDEYSFVASGDLTYVLPFEPHGKEDIIVICNGIILHPDDYTLSEDEFTFDAGIFEDGDEIVIKTIKSTSIITNVDINGVSSPFALYHDGTDGHIVNYSGNMWVDTVNSGDVANGCIKSHGKIYNAVWNDYADFWFVAEGVPEVPGLAYADYGNGLEFPHSRADKCCIGICSDTFGHAMGEKPDSIPIGVAGFVLAYVDKEYPPGTLLVSDTGGVLVKAAWYDILRSRHIAKYIRKNTDQYFNNMVEVKNRHWVKVI